MEARTWRHHLVTFCDHIDWAGTVCHDLGDQPILERTDHPFIPVVHHDDRRVLRVIIVHWDRLLIAWHANFIGIVWVVTIVPVPVTLISVISTSHWISYPGPARAEQNQELENSFLFWGARSNISRQNGNWEIWNQRNKVLTSQLKNWSTNPYHSKPKISEPVASLKTHFFKQMFWKRRSGWPFLVENDYDCSWIPNTHPGRLTWNLQITHFFQTSMTMFHVSLQGV